jgi:hypothetical protein
MKEDGINRACGTHAKEEKGSKVLLANLME